MLGASDPLMEIDDSMEDVDVASEFGTEPHPDSVVTRENPLDSIEKGENYTTSADKASTEGQAQDETSEDTAQVMEDAQDVLVVEDDQDVLPSTIPDKFIASGEPASPSEDAKPDIMQSSPSSQIPLNLDTGHEDAMMIDHEYEPEAGSNVPEMFQNWDFQSQVQMPQEEEPFPEDLRIHGYDFRQSTVQNKDTHLVNFFGDHDQSGNYMPDPDSPERMQRQYPSSEFVSAQDMQENEEGDGFMPRKGPSTFHNWENLGPSILHPKPSLRKQGKQLKSPFSTDSPSNQNEQSDSETSSAPSKHSKKGKSRKKSKSSSKKSKRKTKFKKHLESSKSPKANAHAALPPAPPPALPPRDTVASLISLRSFTHTTKLRHPLKFNHDSSPTDPCSFCSHAQNPFLGQPQRTIQVYDLKRGIGLQELSDLGATNKGMKLCMSCTTARMRIMLCACHELAELPIQEAAHRMGFKAGFARIRSNTPLATDKWCSICPAPAHYTCKRANPARNTLTSVARPPGCGLLLCHTCANALQREHRGDLKNMLKGLKDEMTKERPLGLRADAELLRQEGPLDRFLGWLSLERSRKLGNGSGGK